MSLANLSTKCTFYTKDLKDQEREAPSCWWHWKREATPLCRQLLYHWCMLMQSDKVHGMQQFWSTKESRRDWHLFVERANLQQFSKCHSVIARFVVHSWCSKQSRWRILCWVSALQQNCRWIIKVFFWRWLLLFYEQNHDTAIDFRSWQCSSKTG